MTGGEIFIFCFIIAVFAGGGLVMFRFVRKNKKERQERENRDN